MKIKYVNKEKFRRCSAFILAGTLAVCVITAAKNRNISVVDNEFVNGIYYDEDVRKNRELVMERSNSNSNDNGKVLQKNRLESTRLSKKL